MLNLCIGILLTIVAMFDLVENLESLKLIREFYESDRCVCCLPRFRCSLECHACGWYPVDRMRGGYWFQQR
jgi:hypothetical protein